jgi:hypothetical protein
MGGPPAARCQMGHDISPGASYCAQGHPIALDQMQFASDAYGGGGGAPFGVPPGAPQGYAPPAPGGPYGPPGAPPQAPYGAPQPQQGFPPAQQGGYPGQAPAPGFGGPPAQQGYAPQPAPMGGPPPGGPGFGAPAVAPAFGGDVPPKILRGFLVAYGTNTNGDFWPLTGGRLLVGRLGGSDGIDISVQDPTISSRHAAINVDAPSGAIAVEDTGSTNGTFVNDEHIGFNGRRDLRDGDRLRFGGYTTVVKIIGRV